MTQKYEGVYSQKIEKNNSSRMNIKTLNSFLVVLIILGGLYYVTGINDLVVKGFTLQTLKTKVALLQEQNQGLHVETASLQSYSNLSARVASLNMVPVDNVDYLKINNGVAMAR
jgi:hypothetical protein